MQYMSVEDSIKANIRIKEQILADPSILAAIQSIIGHFIDCYAHNNKVLFCGNGGSAADAQHLAGELSGKLYMDREPLHAEALHVNSSYLTAVANDMSYDEVYARAVSAKGNQGDILICLSTSGNSINVVRAAENAKHKNIMVISFTGESGGKLSKTSDICIKLPSNDVARIQEAYMLIGHIICAEVEQQIFGK